MKNVLSFLVLKTIFLFIIVFFTACSPKVVLQGKLIVPDGKLKYFANHYITLKNNIRVVRRARIDEFGYFEFVNVPKRKNYSIGFDTLSQALEGSTFYIAKINGEKIREFSLDKKFEFKLVRPDLVALSSFGDDNLDVMIHLFKSDTSIHELLVRKYINYDVDSFRISKANKRYINNIVTVLKQNKDFVLFVNAYADANGDDEHNLLLSLKRANEIKKYLLLKGIKPERVFTAGFGETVPLNECVNGVPCSPLQHRLNRRTEFVFKSLEKPLPSKEQAQNAK